MFDRLAGNDNVKIILRRLIERGRIPHSLILAGDDGIGKQQFAIEIAKSFLCREPVDGQACDVCSSCTRAGKFTLPKSDDKDAHKRVIFSEHPDVGKVIAYNRNILVDAIRHLESEANFRPYEGSSRFFIVDDADKMNEAASNALLKTLEEPADTTFLFLITSRPDSLLPTIRSRCQMIRFAPLNDSDIENYLIADRAFTHTEAQLAAHLAGGSIGRALDINVENYKKQRDRMLAVVVNAVEQGDIASLFRISEELNDAKNKDRFEENLSILASLIHDVWLLNLGGDVAKIANTDLADRLSAIAQNAGRSDLRGWIREIELIKENLIVNINRKMAADALFVTMAG